MTVNMIPLDYPKLRQSAACPLCNTPKPIGCVVCWCCYHREGFRHHTAAHIQAWLTKTEAKLAREA